MTETVHQGTIQTPLIDYSDLPMAYWPKATYDEGTRTSRPKEVISAVCRSMADCNDLVHWFDNQPNFCPDLPVLLMIPGAHTLVTGLGYATAAELRDCCIEAWGVKTGGDAWKRFNGDELRERYGYARREDVGPMVQEAFWGRVLRHKASPVTDPWKQFKYPNPTRRTLHKTPDSQAWKREVN